MCLVLKPSGPANGTALLLPRCCHRLDQQPSAELLEYVSTAVVNPWHRCWRICGESPEVGISETIPKQHLVEEHQWRTHWEPRGDGPVGRILNSTQPLPPVFWKGWRTKPESPTTSMLGPNVVHMERFASPASVTVHTFQIVSQPNSRQTTQT